MNTEKGITMIMVIIIISVIICIISWAISNNAKANHMNRLDELTAKACLVTNFEVTKGNLIIKTKDNLQKKFLKNNNKMLIYYDKEKNEKLEIMPEEKIIVDIDTIKQFDMKNAIDYTLASSTRKNKYKYKGIEKYNGKEFYVVKYNKEIFDELVEATTWIDKAENSSNVDKIKAYGYIDMDTGFVVKDVMYFEGEKSITEWDIKIDCVTDKDVKRPDLTGYKKLGEK